MSAPTTPTATNARITIRMEPEFLPTQEPIQQLKTELLESRLTSHESDHPFCKQSCLSFTSIHHSMNLNSLAVWLGIGLIRYQDL